MVYSTDASKWRAYQFSDPFAAGSFYVCNKINTHFCRPDCDAFPVTELHSEIKFVSSAKDAVHLGFSPCKTCDPMSVPTIDVNLLLMTVREINAMIGFVAPLLDDDDEKVTETIKRNILSHSTQRRSSAPLSNAKSAQFSVSKNDSEHYRLIDLACRHLALAAAVSIFSPVGSNASGNSSPKVEDGALTTNVTKRGGRKRRGGVLGFKELATKSKLSAWHFHRVFKSIIGLTPKTYGDMCWEFLEKKKDLSTAGAGVSAMGTHNTSLAILPASSAQSSHPTSSISHRYSSLSRSVTPKVKEEPTPYGIDFHEGYITPPHSRALTSPGAGLKRPHGLSSEDYFMRKRVSYDVPSPHSSPFANIKVEDPRDQVVSFDGQARAISVPNLSTFSSAPVSLFNNSRNLGFWANKEDFHTSDLMFPPHAPYPEEFNLSHFQNEISPTTENISPLNGSAMISPEMSLSMLDVPDSGFCLNTQPFAEGENFVNMEMFTDLFQPKFDCPVDYNYNDPMFSGLASESLSNIDF